MASSKLITVFGATGQQGGAVARALLSSNGRYAVRAVTRNPDSDKAKTLSSVGAEVVKGDLEDAASVAAAVSGAYGVFLVTNYWELLGRVKDPVAAEKEEVSQGKAAIDACARAGVKHLVFSGLELAKEITGKPVPHFDGKGQVERYADVSGVPNTSVRYAFYFENFISFFKPQPQEDGTLVVTLPMDGPMDGICVEDAGPAVVAIFDSPDEFFGKKVGLSGSRMTLHEYAAILSKVIGKTVRYNQIPVDVFASFPFPGADDLANMFDFYVRGNPDRNEALTRKLNPNTLSFEDWANKNKNVLQF